VQRPGATILHVIKANPVRETFALLAPAGIFFCPPQAARGDEVITPAPRAIMPPMMRAGGIPQGQVVQITEHGSELVAVALVALAAATQAAPVKQTLAEVKESKTAPRLFCAGSM